MRDEIGVKSFRLAPMCTTIRRLTLLLWTLPLAFIIASLFGREPAAVPALSVITVYAWVWLRLRPTEFVVHRDRIQVRWPLKRREFTRAGIMNVRVMTDGQQLKKEIGWGVRIGAGGLWGGFGLLWTRRRGIVHMYVSRTDGFVWIERSGDRPWLITPEQPEAFARALSL